MILEIYYSEREQSYIAIIAGDNPYDFSGDAELITKIEGVDWDECMKNIMNIWVGNLINLKIMTVKIPSWKKLIDAQLELLYKGKTCSIWLGEYGKDTSYRSSYKYQLYTMKDQFINFEWYCWENITEFKVVIKSIHCCDSRHSDVKITFEPIQYAGITIEDAYVTMKTLELI